MTTELEELIGESIILTIPCTLCGRKFLPERLEKHTSVCSKTKESEKKRKQFDSSKQRAEIDGLPNGLSILLPKSSLTDKQKATQSATSKKSNWREKHEEFLRTVKAARGDETDENGANNKPRVPVGYIECECCGRNFSEKAADRHIAWCKEQKARIPRSASNAVAMERMKARIKYKPSKIKSITPPSTKSSSTNSTPQRTNTRIIKASPLKSPLMSNNSSPKPIAKFQYKSRANNQTAKKISPPKSDRKRIISLAKPKYLSQYDLDAMKQLPKESVMKFKEKFPNHQCSNDSKEHLIELLKRSPEEYNHCGPRTVPGVRTGGMSPPIKTNNHSSLGYNSKNSHYSDTEDELTKLKARLEEMYINTNSKIKSTNGMIGAITADGMNLAKKPNEINSVETSTTRGSSSDSCNSSIHDQSRDGSSDGIRSQGSVMSSSDGSIPKLCHQCTTKYATVKAKYCYECGARRLGTFGPPFFNI